MRRETKGLKLKTTAVWLWLVAVPAMPVQAEDAFHGERVAFLDGDKRPTLAYAPYPYPYDDRFRLSQAAPLTVAGGPDTARLYINPQRGGLNLPWRLSSLVNLFVGDLPIASTKNWRISLRVSLGR